MSYAIAATVSDLRARFEPAAAETLETDKPAAATAGRVLALRTAGKAGFLDLSDGLTRIQVYVRRDAVGDAAFELYRALDLGDWIGVEGEIFRTRTGRALDQGASPDVSRQVLPSAAREVARPEGRRAALPAALPRSRRQSRLAAGLRAARSDRPLDPPIPRRARVSRGRDADDAADRGRRDRAAVRDAPQRARHGALPSHRAGALSEAPRRRRNAEGVRDQPQLPQRGDLDAAQPRVHDARVLRGLRRGQGPHGPDRRAALGPRARGRGRTCGRPGAEERSTGRRPSAG